MWFWPFVMQSSICFVKFTWTWYVNSTSNFLTTFPTIEKPIWILLGWRVLKTSDIFAYNNLSCSLRNSLIFSSLNKLIFNLWAWNTFFCSSWCFLCIQILETPSRLFALTKRIEWVTYSEKWNQQPKFKSWMRMVVVYFALMHLKRHESICTPLGYG